MSKISIKNLEQVLNDYEIEGLGLYKVMTLTNTLFYEVDEVLRRYDWKPERLLLTSKNVFLRKFLLRKKTKFFPEEGKGDITFYFNIWNRRWIKVEEIFKLKCINIYFS